MFFLIITFSCSDDNISTDNDSIQLVSKITGNGDSGVFESYYHYQGDRFVKSSLNNRSNYEQYFYNSEGKIDFIKLYSDDLNTPDNTSSIDFDNPNNFNDQEFEVDYDWISVNSFVKYNERIYYFLSDGRLDRVECINSSQNCETINVYYDNNNISQVIFNEGESFQAIYTYEFDESKNPIHDLFLRYGYVEYLNLGMFDFFFDFFLPKNPNKVYRNGELVYSAEYINNNLNYPQSASFLNYYTGETGSVVFVYTE